MPRPRRPTRDISQLEIAVNRDLYLRVGNAAAARGEGFDDTLTAIIEAGLRWAGEDTANMRYTAAKAHARTYRNPEPLRRDYPALTF